MAIGGPTRVKMGGISGSLEMTVDGSKTPFAFSTPPVQRDIGTIQLPPGATSLTLGISPKDARLEVPLVDLAKWTAPLFDTTRTWEQRFRGFAENTEGFDINAIELYGMTSKSRLKSLHALAENSGRPVPETLLEVTELPHQASIPNCVDPGCPVMEFLSDDLSYARDQGPGFLGETPARMDALEALYARSVVVLGDANHFTGVIWDPIGIDSATAQSLGRRQTTEGPDGVFWYVASEAGGWCKPVALRDRNGVVAGAEEAVLRAYLGMVLCDLGLELRDAGVIENEDFRAYDSQIGGAITVYEAYGASREDRVWTTNFNPYPLP